MNPQISYAIIISLIALIVSIITSIVNFRRTQRYNTNDFKLSQKVKDETLELISTLRALQLKAIHSSQGVKTMTISNEKEKINSFLHSSTAFAFYVWVGQISKNAGKDPEEWRIFFLRLSEILSLDDIFSAGVKAAELEILFDRLSEKDFKNITSYLSNVPNALQKFKISREFDTAIHAFVNLVQNRKTNTNGKNGDLIEAKLTHLKNKGIADPNIDLFLGVFRNDQALIDSSIKSGADLQMTDSQLLSKYKMQLDDFQDA
jgi:hypothetical protein